MCTVSWVHTATGYELFCNRDERRSRPPAWPPRVRERHGVRFIAPIDGESGGSWLGVNQFGLTLALLNRYDAQHCAPRAEYLSRGWLLLELLDSPSPQHAQERLRARRLTAFQPFTLAAVRGHEPARLFQWDGCRLTLDEHGDAQLPLTSSSYATAHVIAARRAQFAVLQAADNGVGFSSLQAADNGLGLGLDVAAQLARIHRSHVDRSHVDRSHVQTDQVQHSQAPEPGAFSVCMHRADAQTVSYSHIQVDARHITFNYYPQAPCAAPGAPPYATRLELRAA